ncbi:MAG: polysaccharide pyruvyl transferase WcaK-like protein [Parasphingorhabdus sp.]|jgi:polysaccharide pyruvyl transferase WcaK-like protein
MKKLALIGSFSGRNAGDAAILGNILDDFAEVRSDIEFLVPTIKPGFVRKNFGHHNLKIMGMMPWHGSLKALGIANYRAMTESDAILITDNAFFDRKFYNPLVNTLYSIALFTPASRKRNIPIVFYNASVGPIDTDVGEKALQKVLDGTALVTLRDIKTKELFEERKLRSPEVHLHADCAINTAPSDEGRMQSIIRKEGLFTNPNGTITFNVNSYIDNWSNTGTFTRQDFCKVIAESADDVIEKLGVEVLFVVTQVMDLGITRECMEKVRNQQHIKLITNEEYGYSDIVGILDRSETHIGLRTHSLIFCAAVNTPMISINSYPKNTGFMRSIGQDDWMIEFSEINRERVTDLVVRSFEQREQRRNELAPITKDEKRKAKASVDLVCQLIDAKQ